MLIFIFESHLIFKKCKSLPKKFDIAYILLEYFSLPLSRIRILIFYNKLLSNIKVGVLKRK